MSELRKKYGGDGHDAPEDFANWWADDVIPNEERERLDRWYESDLWWGQVMFAEISDDAELEALYARWLVEKGDAA